MDARDYLQEAPAFVERTVREAASVGLDLSELEIDHLCLRVETEAQYRHYCAQFSELGKLLSEALVNGRPIATYKLNEPVRTLGREIHCLEIPSPKAGAPYTLGFEHLECVVKIPLESFISAHDGLDFDARAINKALNAEIALRLPSGSSVKFHNQSLERVIEIEKQMEASL
ncbi:MAG TPA: VOC family protein [Bdellovibrionota bacterium]|jgi:predicted metalloenzyme YecM|nr:VOC family protein [Bdellovibrionota bacterium]